MNRKILILGAILGMLGIVIGAFAAHALRDLISYTQVMSFETGVRYQIYHALLLLFVGGTPTVSGNIKKIVFYCLLIGVIFFQALYML